MVCFIYFLLATVLRFSILLFPMLITVYFSERSAQLRALKEKTLTCAIFRGVLFRVLGAEGHCFYFSQKAQS